MLNLNALLPPDSVALVRFAANLFKAQSVTLVDTVKGLTWLEAVGKVMTATPHRGG